MTSSERRDSTNPVNVLRVVLRGPAQVMFQDSPLTGLLFLVGIAVASPLMGIGAVIGAVIGPLVAVLARFDRDDIEQGIHGFNPVLVGIAALFYLEPEPLTWGLLIVGCVASTFVTHWMRKYLHFPTYTSPFIVVTWVVIVVAHSVAGTAIDVKAAPIEHTPVGFLDEVFRGAAEVMFGANIVTGLLFILGIAVCNWRHAALAFLGSFLGLLVAIYHGDPSTAISLGIYGYNASLAAIAVFLWRESLLIPILAALISVPLTEFFPGTLGIPALTAPFVAASWVVLVLGALETQFLREPATKAPK
jgi:urea transporter